MLKFIKVTRVSEEITGGDPSRLRNFPKIKKRKSKYDDLYDELEEKDAEIQEIVDSYKKSFKR